MAAGKYTVNEVEERTGVPASTLRQWERRYGLPKPERSESGYRLYSDDDVRDIRSMKTLVEDGVPASRAAAMVGEATRPVQGPRPLEELRDELLQALLGLDDAGADRVLAEAHALYPVEDVMLDLVRGVMVEIGDMWHDGRVATTTEHFASSYVQGRIRQLMSLAGQNRGGPPAIVACAPFDQHEIGAMMLAVMLRRNGFLVYYVGANTPVEDLVDMAKALRPAVVAISASSVEGVQQLLNRRAALSGIAPVLALGGAGFNADPTRADIIGGTFLADNVQDGVERLRALVDAGQRSPRVQA